MSDSHSPSPPLASLDEQQRDHLLAELLAKRPPGSGEPTLKFTPIQAALAAELKEWLTQDSNVIPAPPPHRPLNPILGPYELVRTLGKGGMGEVLLATHVILERHVAIKILDQRSGDNDLQGRFHLERRGLARLDHPHIVRATDGGVIEGIHYLVMEYVAGVNLHKLTERLGALSVAEVCAIGRDVASGLQHAHELQFVHRDIKPGNLMLSQEGVVKVLDFGLILQQNGASSLTSVGRRMGTPAFMSPEQDRGEKVDWLTDMYSLGATCISLLMGTPPGARSAADLDCKDLPAALREILLQMVAAERSARPASWRPVLEQFDRHVGEANLPDLWRRYSTGSATESAEPLPAWLVERLSETHLTPTKESLERIVDSWFEN